MIPIESFKLESCSENMIKVTVKQNRLTKRGVRFKYV